MRRKKILTRRAATAIWFSKYNRDTLVSCCILTFWIAVLQAMTGCNNPTPFLFRGEQAHISGRAVYLEGEGCVIHMTTKDTSIEELNDRYIWCQLQHEDWLKTKNINMTFSK